jgi:hypothetical protein
MMRQFELHPFELHPYILYFCIQIYLRTFVKNYFIMSKKKAKKQVQTLSPEKYIRQKSRNLPIYRCFINKDWEEARFAQIVIVREHAGGSLSLCIYEVDLGCLGIKDTFYSFHTPLAKYEEIIREINHEIPYSLAHNIIHAALEFAEEYGFKPHKDFTQTTCYFLEEDTDDIPLMEIPCGRKEDGKPFYVNTGNESAAQTKQILNQLKNTAGEGNYYYLLPEDDDEMVDEENWEDEDQEEEDAYIEQMDKIQEKYEQMSYEEQAELFINFVKKSDEETFSKDEMLQVISLMDILSPTIDEEERNKRKKRIEEELNLPIVAVETLPNSLFAGLQGEIRDIAPDLFCDSYLAIYKDNDAIDALKTFRKKIGEAPVTRYLELFYEEENNSDTYIQVLEACHSEYPDYFLFQMLWNIHLAKNEKEETKLTLINEVYKNLLTQLTLPITDFEMNQFILYYMIRFLFESGEDTKELLIRICAIKEYLSENQWIYEHYIEELWAILTPLQISALADFIEKKEEF